MLRGIKVREILFDEKIFGKVLVEKRCVKCICKIGFIIFRIIVLSIFVLGLMFILKILEIVCIVLIII